MKYLLKQNKEDKGILCDKLIINGFDYYISDGKEIATTELRIDIPKVFDEVGEAWEDVSNSYGNRNLGVNPYAFKIGYNKCKEANNNSDDDMIAFAKFCVEHYMVRQNNGFKAKTYNELLKIFKSNNPKVIYYQ